MAYPQQQAPYPPPGASPFPTYQYAASGQAPSPYGAYPPGPQSPTPPSSSASYGQLPPTQSWTQQPHYAVDPRTGYGLQQPLLQQQQQQQQQYAPGGHQQHPHVASSSQQQQQQQQPHAAHPAFAPVQPSPYQPPYQQVAHVASSSGWRLQPLVPSGYAQMPSQTMPGYISPTAAPGVGPPPPAPEGYHQPSFVQGVPSSPHRLPLNGPPVSTYAQPQASYPTSQGAYNLAQPPHAPRQPAHRHSLSNPPSSSYASPSPPLAAEVGTSTPSSSTSHPPYQRSHGRAGSQPRYPTQKPSELSPLPSAVSSTSVSSRSSAVASMAHRHSPSLPTIPTDPPARSNSMPQPPVTGPPDYSRPSSSFAIPTSSYHGIAPVTSSGAQSSNIPAAGPVRVASPQPTPLRAAAGRPLPSPLPGNVPPPRSTPSPLPSIRPPSPLISRPELTPEQTPTISSVQRPSNAAVAISAPPTSRPLPRPPGGILPSKSLDRGTTSAPGGSTGPGQWASVAGATAGGASSGIARAATLPSAPSHSHQSIVLTSASQPAAVGAHTAPLAADAQVSAPAQKPPMPPAIVMPTNFAADDILVDQLASTSISQTDPAIAHPSSKPELPQTPQKEKSTAPAPFIIPTFTFADDDEADDAAPPSPAHSASSPGPKISFSSPKASPASSGGDAPPLAPHQQQPPSEPPAVEAKSSTAARETSRLRNGALANGGVGVGGDIHCETCQEQILGRLVSGAGGKFWHPKCFRCTTCNLLLEHVSSFEHEGKLYCHLDYHELFTTRCYTCKTPIVDERFFTINDPSLGTPRYYHELHFFCSECGDPFLDPHRSSSAGTEKLRHGKQASANDGDDDVEAMTANINLWRGHPYCDGCHVRLHAPKCKGCRKPIAGEMLEALGGKWHAGCLKCETCEGPFEGLRIFEHEGMGLCETCFSCLLRADL